MAEIVCQTTEAEQKDRPRRRNAMSIPLGSATQQNSSEKLFDEYLLASNITWENIEDISIKTKTAEQKGSHFPSQTTYTVLEGFVRFLYSYEASAEIKRINIPLKLLIVTSHKQNKS